MQVYIPTEQHIDNGQYNTNIIMSPVRVYISIRFTCTGNLFRVATQTSHVRHVYNRFGTSDSFFYIRKNTPLYPNNFVRGLSFSISLWHACTCSQVTCTTSEAVKANKQETSVVRHVSLTSVFPLKYLNSSFFIFHFKISYYTSHLPMYGLFQLSFIFSKQDMLRYT